MVEAFSDLACVALSLALVGCAAARPASQPPTYPGVAGRVIDSDTGAPLDDAFVILHASNAVRPRMMSTDAQGLFALGEPGQAYQLTVARDGFETVHVAGTAPMQRFLVRLRKSARWASPAPFRSPKLLVGYNPSYSPEALRKHVQGTLYVGCAVLLNTRVDHCAVLQGMPEMNENVKFAFEQRRYAPAVIDGVPTAVDFIFKMTLALE
jgi:carboxypeptidase family protein/TonB-like protein